MGLIVDESHRGPSEQEWARWSCSYSFSTLNSWSAKRVVVIAPHPDDEVLGAGGLIQIALRRGIPVHLIAVSDGESSHPFYNDEQRTALALERRSESAVAFRRLGAEPTVVHRLGLKDGAIGENCAELEHAFTSVLRHGDLCVAPWQHDGHPDHDVCGAAALTASRATGARTLGYLVWAWHWANPLVQDIPREQCVRLKLDRRAVARKRWSTMAFTSQICPRGVDGELTPVLPDHVLRRFWRPFEMFVDEMGVL